MNLQLKQGERMLDLEPYGLDASLPDDWIGLKYYQKSEDSWDVGEEEFITKADLSVIAAAFRGLLHGSAQGFAYTFGVVTHISEEKTPPLLRILLTKERMELSMLDTLDRETYIQVEGTELSKYASIFWEWERQFCGRPQVL